MPMKILLAAYIFFLSLMCSLVVLVPAFAGELEEKSSTLFDFEFRNALGDWFGEVLAGYEAASLAGGEERPAALSGLATQVSYALRPLAWSTGPDRSGEHGGAMVDADRVESLLVDSHYYFGSGTRFIPHAGMRLGVARVPGAPGSGAWASDGVYGSAYTYESGFGVSSLLDERLLLGISYRYRMIEEGRYGLSANDLGDHKVFLAVDYRY